MAEPIFVRIEEYRDVLEVVSLIKKKLTEARETLEKINELKNEEDREMERWQNGLEALERKMQFVDKALFEPEAV